MKTKGTVDIQFKSKTAIRYLKVMALQRSEVVSENDASVDRKPIYGIADG